MTFATSTPGLPNLEYRSVNSSLDDALGSALSWNWPSHLNDFLLNPWQGHVQHVVLHPLLRSEHREFDRVLHCSRHRDTDVESPTVSSPGIFPHDSRHGNGVHLLHETGLLLVHTLTTSSIGSSVHDTDTSVICPQFSPKSAPSSPPAFVLDRPRWNFHHLFQDALRELLLRSTLNDPSLDLCDGHVLHLFGRAPLSALVRSQFHDSGTSIHIFAARATPLSSNATSRGRHCSTTLFDAMWKYVHVFQVRLLSQRRVMNTRHKLLRAPPRTRGQTQ